MNAARQIVTPYLCCRDATRALAFYERAFGAVVSNRAKYGGSPYAIHLVVPDVDSLAERAVAAGATLERPVADQPHDRLT